jgi:thiol-disulfide isomerase/thioredoxin
MKINFMMKTIFLILIVFYSTQVLSHGDHSQDKFALAKLRTVTLESWQQELESFKGEIVVVDMWATWCSSCIERFPAMVQMQKDYKNKGVRLVSMLLEDPQEPEAIVKARQFLTTQDAGFDHYFMNENLMKSFEELDLLGIPAVYIYSADGMFHSKLTGDNPNKQFTDQDIKDTIDALLTTELEKP